MLQTYCLKTHLSTAVLVSLIAFCQSRVYMHFVLLATFTQGDITTTIAMNVKILCGTLDTLDTLQWMYGRWHCEVVCTHSHHQTIPALNTERSVILLERISYGWASKELCWNSDWMNYTGVQDCCSSFIYINQTKRQSDSSDRALVNERSLNQIGRKNGQNADK